MDRELHNTLMRGYEAVQRQKLAKERKSWNKYTVTISNGSLDVDVFSHGKDEQHAIDGALSEFWKGTSYHREFKFKSIKEGHPPTPPIPLGIWLYLAFCIFIIGSLIYLTT